MDNPLIESVHVAITFADDTLGIMQFVTRTPRWNRLATADNVEAEISRSFFGEDKMPIKSWRFIDRQELPAHRRYRDAWVDLGQQRVAADDLTTAAPVSQRGGIVHDMDKARDIHRDLLREQRALLFPGLDADYLRADETGNTAEKLRIAAVKQQLRDLPAHPDIDSAENVEELEGLTMGAMMVPT